MKKAVPAVVLAALAAAAAATQQTPVRRYTTPSLPRPEALDRLHLALAWSNKLPTAGSQDGLYSFQLLPAVGGRGYELLVQTRLGVVFLLDAATGDVLWRTPVGRPFEFLKPCAYTDEDVYAVRAHRLFVLDRKTGRQRLFTVDPGDGHISYGFDLGGTPSAAPGTDGERVYLVMENRAVAWLMPRFSVTEAPALGESAPAPPAGRPYPGSAPPAGPPAYPRAPARKEQTGPPAPSAVRSSAQPAWAWGALTEGWPLGVPVVFAPVVIGDTVNTLGGDGTLISLQGDKVKERYRYKVYGGVDVPMGQHGWVVYIAAEDHRVYALDVETRALLWRFPTGAPVLSQPWVTDRDVFVAARRLGLYRVDRDSGEAVWLNRRARQFLATNQKLVYAADRDGKLIVLDYARGTTLTDYDLAAYMVRFSNEVTDRIFLGAHDGTLICLHNRDNREPFRVRVPPPPPAPKKEAEKEPGKEAKEEMKKPAEKKEEEPKEAPAKEEMKKEAPKKDLKKDKGKADEEKAGRAGPMRPADLARALSGGGPAPAPRRFPLALAPGEPAGPSRRDKPGGSPQRTAWLCYPSNSSSGRSTGSPRSALRATASVNSM